MRRRIRNLFALGFLFIAACGGADQTTGGREQAEERATPIAVTATDFAFEHPPTVDAGAVELQLTNRGKAQHILILARVSSGATLDEAREALLSDAPPQGGAPPFSFVPGVAEVTPGRTGNSTQVLQPGQYIMICPIPDTDGTPHFAKGMVSTFEATGAGGGTLPTPTATVTAQEFAFLNVPQLDAGDHVVGMRNTGKQEHEMNLAELAPGKTVDDIVEFMKQPPGQGGAPPMTLHGGVLMQPGLSATARFTLEAGKQYAFVCMVPDFSETPPAPHIVKGMYSQAFTPG